MDVLALQLAKGRHPYKSKWPPDRAPVTVKHARMTPDAYAALLRTLAIVDSAKLSRVPEDPMRGFSSSSRDFWVYARLTAKNETLVVAPNRKEPQKFFLINLLFFRVF